MTKAKTIATTAKAILAFWFIEPMERHLFLRISVMELLEWEKQQFQACQKTKRFLRDKDFTLLNGIL